MTSPTLCLRCDREASPGAVYCPPCEEAAEDEFMAGGGVDEPAPDLGEAVRAMPRLAIDFCLTAASVALVCGFLWMAGVA